MAMGRGGCTMMRRMALSQNGCKVQPVVSTAPKAYEGIAFFSSDSENMEKRAQLATEHYQDFTLQYPPRREYFKELFRTFPSLSYAEKERLFRQDSRRPETLETPSDSFAKTFLLYTHIPFCQHKCSYCNFAVDTRQNKDLHQGYVDRIVSGLSTMNTALDESEDDIRLHGIDIGGGTPTALKATELERLLSAMRPLRERCTHPRPLSIETTPVIVTEHQERMQALRDGGVDRISMGLQSTNEELLEEMRRGKEVGQSARAVRQLQNLGFSRVSVDIIFGLPGQTMEHWKRDVHNVVDMGVDVITAYDCLYRGKGRSMANKQHHVPSQEQYAEMYDYCYQHLTANGYYAHYGGVNFSLRPEESGTSAYFEGRLLDGLQYVGLGNYASSMCQDRWWFAPYHVDQWIADVDAACHSLPASATARDRLSAYFPISDCYTLPFRERAAKYALLSLSFGILDDRRFLCAFGMPVSGIFGQSIDYALHKGWMTRTPREGGFVYGIAEGNFRWINQLRSLFYSDRAIRWIGDVKEDSRRQYAHKKRKPTAKATISAVL